MIRIKTSSFTDLKPTDLAMSAQQNVDAVSSQPEFAGITPLPAEVQNFIRDLNEKIALAAHGTKIQKNERNAAKSILLSCLAKWSNFVLMKANAKASEQEQLRIVHAAAFVPITRGSSIGALSAVKNPRAKTLSRAIAISWRALPGAHSYQVLKTGGYANENSVWTEVQITTRVRITMPSAPAEIVSFIIYPLGTAGKGTGSTIVTCLAGL
ncbi:MAG: hypothetical protein SH857_12860 [Chitinophagales bacterium]|nr:hypothetical protein [Chitinophagales bacterium]